MTELAYQDWMTLRKTWARNLTQDQLRQVMDYVQAVDLPELTTTVMRNAVEGGFSMERLRAECLLWLSTRGQEGDDWGIPAFWAYTNGLWPPNQQAVPSE